MRELKSSYMEEFTIRSYDTDIRQKLRVTRMFQYLQDVAGKHVADTPLGYGSLKERGQFWVLVRIRARIERMPSWKDQISIGTWAKKMDRMFAYREFEILDGGSPAVSVSSEWMLMDRETRKPCRLSTLPAAMPTIDRDSIPERLAKIVPEGTPLMEVDRMARYSDIDMYHHVNNAKYIEWALDCFDVGFLSEHEIREIQVNFVAEVGPGEVVGITLTEAAAACEGHGAGEGPDYYIEGYNKTRETKAFQMEVRLR